MSQQDIEGDEPVLHCWMCGRPARSGCAVKFLMYAHPARRLDGLGYPVQRGKWQDEVRIEIPRCAGCRSWVGGWIAVVVIAAVAAAIAGTLIQSFFLANVAAPPWLRVSHEGIGNIGTAIGLVLGFVVALLTMARERTRSGRQSVNSYPPLVTLRKLGWAMSD